jgi:hypothetical protein
MPKRGAPLTRFWACVMLGCSLSFVAASFLRQWRAVCLPDGRFIGASPVNFWGALADLLLALGCGDAQGRSIDVCRAEAVKCLPGNARTTALALAAGACLGCAAWGLRRALAVWSARPGSQRNPPA